MKLKSELVILKLRNYNITVTTKKNIWGFSEYFIFQIQHFGTHFVDYIQE